MRRYLILLLLVTINSIIFSADRTPAAFIDLKPGNGINDGLALMVSDYFRTQLVNRNHYLIVSRENMQEILAEQQYQISGCTSQECIVQMGKVLGVKYIFTGTLGKVGSIFLLNIKLLNVETGEIAQAKSAEAQSEEALLTEIIALADLLSGIKERTIISPPPQINSPVDKEPVPGQKGHNFVVLTYGFGVGSLRLNLSNPVSDIFKSHLGVSGSFSDSFDNIEWRHLKASFSTPLSLKIGGLFDFKKNKKGFPGLTVEIYYQKAEVISEEADTYIDGYNVGKTYLPQPPYLEINMLAVDVQVAYYLRAFSFLSFYGGAGFGITMNMWSSDYMMGYTTGSGVFETPSSGYAYGFMVHLPIGILFNMGGLDLICEYGFWATLFTFTRNIKDETDTVDMLVPLLKIGIGAKF